MAKPRSPFDLTLTDGQRTTVGQWLAWEIENGLAAKYAQDGEVDYWHRQYEQARTRTKNLPWPDAADLTSHIPCEKVDSIHARMMRTVWTEPLCTVSGYGQAADRAPFVEEFHQWKVEEEDLQSVLDRLFLTGLIEPRALLEVSESGERRTARKTITAKPEQDPVTGGYVFDQQGNIQLQRGPDGAYVETTQPSDFGVRVTVDSSDVVRTGPQYRVLSYRDSLILPGHASNESEIWAYAKRIFKRRPDLLRLAQDGVYDLDVVNGLADTSDREPTPQLERANMGIAPQRTETAEKELWEVLWLIDLNAFLTTHNQDPIKGANADGARWYLATLHVPTGKLLRLNHDDFERSRFVPLVLFPRPDRVTEGFSFVGHKLITVTEEHTAYRNMSADACSKAVNAPIKRMQGALWDADEQPLGPKSIIDVRDPREIEAMEMPDVPQSVFLNIQSAERASDRLAGINDIASGQQVEKGNPTLGEIQMATEQSFVRMDLIVRRAQKALEAVMQIRHAIWKRVLAEQQDGMEAPESVLVGLECRGVPIDQYLPNGKITAALLDGPFRFKPYGSVETADLNRLRNDYVGMMQALPMLLQAFPQTALMFQSPQAARAMARQFFRVFRIPNPQAFLGSPSQDLLGQGGLMPGQQVPMMGQPTGIPPGAPPAPGQDVMPPPPLPAAIGGPPGMPMAAMPPGVQ